MAEIHVLTTHGTRVKFALHVPVPGMGTNVSGIQWRAALLNSGLGGATVLRDSADGAAGTIGPTEKTQITNGELYEAYVETALPSNWGTMSGSERIQWVDSLYNANAQSNLDRLKAQLNYFGFTREVP